MKFLRNIYAWIVKLLSPEPRKGRDLGDDALRVLEQLDQKHPKGTPQRHENPWKIDHGMPWCRLL